MFIIRGCDTFDVQVCPGVLGRELFNSMKMMGDTMRHLLLITKFPVPMFNRIAFGFAASAFGGRNPQNAPPYCLTAADFQHYSVDFMDNWVPPAGVEREKRPQYPTSIDKWVRQTGHQIKVFSLVYGRQHSLERTEMRDHLENLHENEPHQYTTK